MFIAPNAKVISITRNAEGVSLRCSVDGKGTPYYFTLEASGDEAVSWVSEFNLGDSVSVQGLPYAKFNKERVRYELFIAVAEPTQHRMPVNG